MWVESQVGLGSTFYFTVVAASLPNSLQADYQSLQPLSGKRLLIVDDNATNRKILTLQGQSWGMLTRAAASASEALEWLSQGDPFDIAILDMQMPHIDSLTLAAEIRQQPHCQELPLVMLTSIGRQEAARQADTVEFAAFLHKPVKQSQLYDALLLILGKRSLKAAPFPTSSTEINTQRSAGAFSGGARKAQAQFAQAHPLRILLAEDNVVNQKVALLILQWMGYRADISSNGLEVLQALERHAYDVVLMDMHMPEMDGLEATRRICQNWSSSRPRIIAMTANAMQGDRETCIHAGMDDYVSKPIQVEELVKALSKCQPKGPASPALIDSKAIEALRDMAGEAASEILEQVINSYLEDAPQLLHAMNEAVTKGNAIALRHAAHTLKSTSATLGATSLSQICKDLDKISQVGTTVDAETLVSQVEVEYAKVRAALQELLMEDWLTVNGKNPLDN